MLGTGLTFNLGRDITLLVLRPVIFAYVFVRLAEIWAAGRFKQLPNVTTIGPSVAGPAQVVAGRLNS